MKAEYNERENMKTLRPAAEKVENNVARRSGEIAGWIIPGTILALLPKCPVCVAAYVALWTGIGLSLSAATHLRTFLMLVCIGVILCLVAINARRLFQGFRHHQETIRRRMTC